MILYPNAKLNLGLQIVRKREDGFHELRTLFVPYFGLKDILEVLPAKELKMYRYGLAYDGKAMDNICIKAYRALEEDFAIPPVEIHLYKKIPVGAGLGGGSADGSFTLIALNEIYKLGLSKEQLCKYAAKIGSDCPFFIYNQPMMASGRGEILTQYDFLMEDYKFEVINPKIHITTAEAYSKIIPRERLKSMVAGGEDISSLTDCPIDKLDTSLEEILSLEPSSWRELLINDFEPSTFERHPKLAEIKSDLYSKGAIYASLSGSGSAMFGMFKR